MSQNLLRSRAPVACAFVWAALAAASAARGQGLVDPPLPDGRAAAEKQLAALRLPAGLKAAVFAAEPQLASPVAIGLDELGRVFVAEEYRFNRGTEENRTRPFLLADDLQLRTTADRLAMFRKHAERFEGGMDWFTRYTDQIRLLEDQDGDGRADLATVFASGFNGPLDGILSGVLAKDGDVYATCIPHLWRLRDTNGDGVADERKQLLSGFGVNASFLGHDLHGLAWGPDGKLYFSIGDRGFHVVAGGKTHSEPRRGAVFRCLPDGSEFEVVHVGLRNPQELAFDDFGNLFADDNNSDKGDDARLVFVVEGGDSGWNMAFQSLTEPYLTGPWHAERMWQAADVSQPAWLLPRVGKLGAGPSGFAYYPGLGLPERYRGYFFMANYTGGGGIEAFTLKPSGASFEIADYHDFLKPIQATDLEFGYDGKVYVSDFVGLDWSGKTKGGRIYTVWDTQHLASPQAAEIAALFRTGFTQRSSAELGRLLRHVDQRVRLRAQFALAERGAAALPTFSAALAQREHRLARLHGLWGIGQLARKSEPGKAAIVATLEDDDVELRVQAARLAGDCRCAAAGPRLQSLLGSGSPREQLFAAQSLGKLGDHEAVERLWEFLAGPGNSDRYLRHAGVYALHRLQAQPSATAKLRDPSPAVRLAALLVLRLARDERLAAWLDDPDPAIVLEAARAINDLPLESQTAQLAALARRLLSQPRLAGDALVRRVIGANFQLGGTEQAVAVAELAASPWLSPAARREAIFALSAWHAPNQRDRVTGEWRPVTARTPGIVRCAVTPERLVAILAAATGDAQQAAIDMASQLELTGGDDLLVAWFEDRSRSDEARVAVLRLLAQRKHPRTEQWLAAGLADGPPPFRAQVLALLASLSPARGETAAIEFLQEERSVREHQAALAVLAGRATPAAEAALAPWARRLAAGEAPPELALELLEAFRGRTGAVFVAASEAYLKAPSPLGSLAGHKAALSGGDAARGRALFVNHAQAQCIRCHQVAGLGGGAAGPELTRAATRLAGPHLREQLLESLLAPSVRIAEGFASVTVALADGRVVGGLLKREQNGVLEILTPQGELKRIAAGDIAERVSGPSPMPSMEKVLSPRELRDLVEFLTTLK